MKNTRLARPGLRGTWPLDNSLVSGTARDDSRGCNRQQSLFASCVYAVFSCARTPAPLAWLRGCLGLLIALVLNAPAQASLTYNVGPETAFIATTGLTVSGSEWMRCPVGMTATSGSPVTCSGTPDLYTYAGALQAVAQINANLAPGVTHWQIPTAEYLGALLTTTPPQPRLDTTVFPNTPTDNVFWSSTPPGLFPLTSQARLMVDFSDASMSTVRFIQGTDKGYLRLVRPATAEFHQVTFTTPGNGTINPASAWQVAKANLFVDLTPDAGYTLTEVARVSGDCAVDELASLLFGKAYVTMGNQHCTVQAIFTAAGGTWPISSNTTPAGAGTLNCPAVAANLDDTDCYATPYPGFRLSHFTGCNASTGNTCHLRSVTAARNVTAVFTPASASNPAAIPSLGFWALLALSGLLGLGGLWRRRQGC